MSARLIKVASGTAAQLFAPFAIPANGDGSASLTTYEMANAAVVICSDTPETEAERIVAEALARAADIERQARDDGRASIQAEVAAEVTRIVDPWREELKNTLAEITDLRATITAQAEQDLVALSIEIAKKIIHREIAIDNEIVMTLARLALSRVHNRTAATIHLHPEDFAYVSSQRESLEAGRVLELVEDRSISRGGCLVLTELGDFDARIEQQFEEVERVFLET